VSACPTGRAPFYFLAIFYGIFPVGVGGSKWREKGHTKRNEVHLWLQLSVVCFIRRVDDEYII